jgi:hypothetical protein
MDMNGNERPKITKRYISERTGRYGNNLEDYYAGAVQSPNVLTKVFIIFLSLEVISLTFTAV